ncbi:MAG: CDP-glucose 4,6-dehydratase [Deltaproteobacteria bacterium]|nr:CDP-glucose 4,6-dehydratase [Deltaproteobacteria bacterium]
MEDLVDLFGGAYSGRRVLVTGHSGFKGSWLTLWLRELGADVRGLSLDLLRPSLHATIFGDLTPSSRGDVRELRRVEQAFAEAEPEIVFHLAAQALVRPSYSEPVTTFDTNVMGTVHVLEAVRHARTVRLCQIVTSDKCYENREWVHPYREVDRLGGRDPYSSSKAAAELVTRAYTDSFFPPSTIDQHHVSVSSVRAGNVIGGGDWATDRIVPDCIRSLSAGEAIQIRSPQAIRPWQYVLEALYGYLLLGAHQLRVPGRFEGAWNFGPDQGSTQTVGTVASRIVELWGSGRWDDKSSARNQPHEAMTLRLDSSKAQSALGWAPTLSLDEALRETVAWYRTTARNNIAEARHEAVAAIRRFSQLASARRPQRRERREV